jgi:hypothetical protein
MIVVTTLDVTVMTPLHNVFGPQLDELPGLVPSLPGGPDALRSASA